MGYRGYRVLPCISTLVLHPVKKVIKEYCVPVPGTNAFLCQDAKTKQRYLLPRITRKYEGLSYLKNWRRLESGCSLLGTTCYSCLSFASKHPNPFVHFLPTTLRFLTLFFWSYFCLIGPFNSVSLYESLPRPCLRH